MNQQLKPVSDDELHAYVDGELATERAAEIEAWLAAHPDAAERVQTYRQQNQTMRALFDPVLDEPVPASLTATLARRSAPWARAAAVA